MGFSVTLHDRSAPDTCSTVHIDGEAARSLSPDERGIAALLYRRINGHSPVKGRKKAGRKARPSALPKGPGTDETGAGPAEVAAPSGPDPKDACLEGITLVPQQSLGDSLRSTVAVHGGVPLLLLLEESAPLIDGPDGAWRDALDRAAGLIVVLGDNRGLGAREEDEIAALQAAGDHADGGHASDCGAQRDGSGGPRFLRSRLA